MNEAGIAAAAKNLLQAAVDVLTSQGVLPTSRFITYIHVGFDYEGGSLMGLPQYEALASLIENSHPRFRTSLHAPEWESPNEYIFPFIEAFIALCNRKSEPLTTGGQSAEIAISHLLRALASSEREAACRRVVTHLTTEDGSSLALAGVTVSPVGGEPWEHRRRTARLIDAVIPGAGGASRTEPSSGFEPPDSVLIARHTQGKPQESVKVARGTIDRFLLMCRLLKAGTGTAQYEVEGETGWCGGFGPHLVPLDGRFGSMRTYSRITTLTEHDEQRFDGMAKLLDACGQKPSTDMLVTSLGMALHKFDTSYRPRPWWERIVDLATAFEACLSGTDTSDVTLRIRTRAAALLVTADDDAKMIFADIKNLYKLRSRLVHGGSLKQREGLKMVKGLSTVPDTTPPGLAFEYAVDRFRDLVRRALLMRMCLGTADAAGEMPWRFDVASDDVHVDPALADDTKRVQWRASWRDRLASFNAGAAAERAEPLQDLLSPR